MSIKDLSFSRTLDADIREQQSREHQLRQERYAVGAPLAADVAPDRRTKFQTLLHKQAQAWDWIDITTDLEDKDAPRARVFIRKVGKSVLTLGLELSGGVRGYSVAGDFDPLRTTLELGEDGQCLIDLEQYLHGGWDWVQLLFGGTVVDVIVARAWYRKVALTVRAPRSIAIRKTEAPG